MKDCTQTFAWSTWSDLKDSIWKYLVSLNCAVNGCRCVFLCTLIFKFYSLCDNFTDLRLRTCYSQFCLGSEQKAERHVRILLYSHHLENKEKAPNGNCWLVFGHTGWSQQWEKLQHHPFEYFFQVIQQWLQQFLPSAKLIVLQPHSYSQLISFSS